MPAVSICIPAYKAEKYLRETLASVRQQMFTDWELIVTEDGSRDSTEQIVREFATTVLQPVHYTRHDPNRGLPATRNAAIEGAPSDWIAILDSDDLWTPDHLSSCMDLAHSGTADLVHSGSILFESETGKTIERRAPSLEDIEQMPLSLFRGTYIIQPASVVLHRSLWERAGRFDPTFRYVEDRDMWLRCARAGGRIRYTGKETCLYRKHANALSTHAAPMAEAAARVFDKHLDWENIPHHLRIREASEGWISAARLQRHAAPVAARQCLRRALAIRPTSLRALALWFATFTSPLLNKK